MSKSTFKILFYIRKNQVNKDGTVCIMVRLTVSGDVTQFSSKLNVDPKAWDVRLGKVAGNSVKARQLNDLYLCTALKRKALPEKEVLGEVAEWSIAAVLKTVVLRGTRGSNPVSPLNLLDRNGQ